MARGREKEGGRRKGTVGRRKGSGGSRKCAIFFMTPPIPVRNFMTPYFLCPYAINCDIERERVTQ